MGVAPLGGILRDVPRLLLPQADFALPVPLHCYRIFDEVPHEDDVVVHLLDWKAN